MHPSAHVHPDREGLERAAAEIRLGHLVVIPTDTVYGVAADPRDPAAVARLFAAKGRPRQLRVPVLVGDAAVAASLAAHLSEAARTLMDAFWPGPLSIVVRLAADAGLRLDPPGGPDAAPGSLQTVALRQPDHPQALALLALTGPLAVTSANLTSHPPARTAAEAAAQLGDAVACYLDGGPTPGRTASSIVDCSKAAPRLLREGAVSLSDLERALVRAGARA
ncbi:MAG: threonylcarbamoyl-AMP synthase [Bifidobacteriaceae bacterium]|jgi:tRNA threonylcarbamoyl adenosine modification protein (Sua5/YciO/YrdC/YwlC family)|nr:threonylcarbamoyl-AMP synthase [Bifidobacteriaceae bacterium]